MNLVDRYVELIRDHRRRMTVLLFALFGVIAATPFVEDWAIGRFPAGLVTLDTLTGFALLTAVYSVAPLRRPRLWLLVLAVPAIAALVAPYLLTHPDLRAAVIIVMHLLIVAFFSLVMWWILRHVLEGGRVTLDEINGAVCVYIMLAMGGAYVFSLLEYLQPGSFTVLNETVYAVEGVEPGENHAHRQIFVLMLYHAIVTLTTLGFGDVQVHTDVARIASALLAIFGQVYLVVLVARLVGLHISGDHVPRAPRPPHHDRDHR